MKVITTTVLCLSIHGPAIILGHGTVQERDHPEFPNPNDPTAPRRFSRWLDGVPAPAGASIPQEQFATTKAMKGLGCMDNKGMRKPGAMAMDCTATTQRPTFTPTLARRPHQEARHKEAQSARVPSSAPSCFCVTTTLFPTNGHLYKLGPRSLNYTDAIAYAQQLPTCCGVTGHLVTISSQLER